MGMIIPQVKFVKDGVSSGDSMGSLAFAPISIVVMVVGLLAAVALAAMQQFVLALLVAFASIYALFSIRQTQEWERGVVLRLGKIRGLRGPGLFTVIPVVDSVVRVIDQRVRATDVTAESALTKDTVPVNVDAIVFWVVWDAQKAALEVQDYFAAVAMSAQTALRESIGSHELSEILHEREKLNRALQKILDEKTNPWGLTVQSVEIREVVLPQALEDAMSREAQAERERRARIILGTAETEISAKFAQAALVYENNPTALHLRAMNMLYEAIKEKGSMVIVPSSAVETMGLGGMLATASLGKQRPQ